MSKTTYLSCPVIHSNIKFALAAFIFLVKSLKQKQKQVKIFLFPWLVRPADETIVLFCCRTISMKRQYNEFGIQNTKMEK